MVFATSVVVTLVATTFTAIVAAQGTAQLTIHVQYQGPRPLAGSAACPVVSANCFSYEDVHYELLSVADTGGYGYGYGYGYQFLNWLQNGYGYSQFSVEKFLDGDGVTILVDNMPVGEYRVRVWLDLDHDGIPDELLEPLAFAEESDGDDVLDLGLNDEKSARAVIAEVASDLSGLVELDTGAPALGAEVVAVGPFGDEYHATTDALGAFTLAGLPSGLWYSLEYEVLVHKERYHEVNATLHLPKEGLALSTPFVLLPTTIDVPFTVKNGWSLVSIPVLPENGTVKSVFGGRVALPLYTWSGTGYTELWENDTLQPGVGYWAFTGKPDETFNLTGVPIPVTLHLDRPGWHLVGGPAHVAPFDPVPANVEPVLWTWHTDHYVPEGSLVPTHGYWVLVVNGTATIPLEGSS